MSRTRHRPRAALAIALVVVVANAALQALFVALAPRDALDAGAIALATLSGIALTAASAALCNTAIQIMFSIFSLLSNSNLTHT